VLQASSGVARALLVVLAGAIGVACYEVPAPDCGFLCGPNGACPDDYMCADDHHCHRIGAPADLVCSTPDAAPDAGIDAAIDAAIDATPDAMLGAVPGVMLDAPVTPR
jgi:hypothetical protein